MSVDDTKFLNSLLLLSVLLFAMAAFVVSMLYKYILLKRKKSISVMRIVGMTKTRAFFINYIEFVSIGVFMYTLAAAIFNYLILPMLRGRYKYIASILDFNMYLLVGVIFVIVLSLFLFFSVRKSHKEIFV